MSTQRTRIPRALILVLLLPLLIAGVGVWGLKDRASALDRVPAAVVNLDEGANMTVDGEEQFVPFGRLLAGALTHPETMDDSPSDTTGFDWQLTTRDDATAGLKDGTYSAVVIIPEDFSTNLATMGTKDVRQARIEVTTNDASGLLDSAVGQAIAAVVTNEFNTNLASQYLDGIYLGFNDLQQGYQDAADGAGDLADGAGQLKEGTRDMAGGARDLEDGAVSLADGTRKLAGGTDDLAAGASDLSDGAAGLAGGTAELSGGASEVAGGARALAGGSTRIASGADQLAGGTTLLADGLYAFNSGMPRLSSGARELSSGAYALAGGSRGIADGVNDLSGGIGGLAQGADDLATGVEAIDEGFNGTSAQPGLRQGITTLTGLVLGDGTPTNPGLAGNADLLADGLTRTADSIEAFAAQIPREDLQRLGDGAHDLNEGLAATAPGAHAVAEGNRDLASGAEDLQGGALQLSEGLTGVQGAMRGDGTSTNPGLLSVLETLRAQCSGPAPDAPTTDVPAPDTPMPDTAMLDATSCAQIEAAYAYAVQIDQGLGNQDVPGLLSGAENLATGATELSTGANDLAGGATQVDEALNGTEQQPGLAAGAAQLDEALNGDGTRANPGLVGALMRVLYGDGSADTPGIVTGLNTLADGAREAADRIPEFLGGIRELDQGTRQIGDGIAELSPGARALADGLSDTYAGSADLARGSSEIATGMEGVAAGSKDLSDGIGQVDAASGQFAGGARDLAVGATDLASGTRELAGGTTQLAGGAETLAAGASALSTGMGSYAQGMNDYAFGVSSLASGAGDLADGADQLAGGTTELAGGADDLASGTEELADGTDQLAEGLTDGAAQVPTYTESERARLTAASTSPVTLSSIRENEVSGGATATFPFAAALGLWLGAFATFLVWPAMRRRFVDSAMPMWMVALRSLAPALAVAVIQALLVIAMLLVFQVKVSSFIGIAAIALGAALVFAAVHQMFLTVCGPKVGRIVSVVVLVLQVVALVGIVPLESAPPLLQSLTALMPLTVATQGLVHAALGGAIVTTGATIGLLAVFGAVSLGLTLVAARKARAITARTASAEVA